MKKSSKSKVSKYVTGASIAAAVAAGVVAFLTQTKKGKALAAKGREHASDLSKAVAHRMESMRAMTKEKYEETIDEVVADYLKKKKITKEAAKDLAAELKKEWQQVKRELKK